MVINFVTQNELKFEEIKRVIPSIKMLRCSLPEIQSLDPEEILKNKLDFASSRFPNLCVLVDDTSLYLEAFDYKLPGPFIAYFMCTVGTKGLFELCSKLDKMGAEARTVLGLKLPQQDPIFFSGLCKGELVKPVDESFTSWDGIFKPSEADNSFLEMGLEKKSEYSMRTKAAQKLKDWLVANNYL